MQPVSTSMNGKTLKISWQAPNNGAASISAYKILIQHMDGVTLSEQLFYCDGSNFLVIANLFCEIPMNILVSSPFNLV